MVIPKHIAVVTKGCLDWARKTGKSRADGYKQRLTNVLDMVDFQTKNKIPIMTYYLLSSKITDSDYYLTCIDALVDFFNKLIESKTITENKIKISIIGKWYNLPGRLVEVMKKIIEETSDYDNYFLNLCINYDGQEEVVDACRLIGRRVKLGRIDADSISKADIKNDLYSSYFLPPDLMIIAGKYKILRGFLLWDCANSTVYFSDKMWPEFDEEEMKKAIEYWEKYK